jgi:hypothetical protein
MFRFFSSLLWASSFLLLGSSLASGQEWGCYDPKPGHPSLQEKQAFVAEAGKFAKEAEQKFGVPAPAIAAMSVIESGYGFTHIALEANNFFGYKFTGSGPAEGRPSWQLTCQPASDPNNRYIQFKDRQDAFLFVGRKLAVLPRYVAATSEYMKARATGSPLDKAADAWVRAIADAGYNPDPGYPGRVIAIMSNPIDPSGSYSPSDNLYRLSEAGSPTTTPVPAAMMAGVSTDLYTRVVQYVAKNAHSVPYMKQKCAPTSFPNWDGIDIEKCEYTVGRDKPIAQTAIVILYVPTEEQLTNWYLSACQLAVPAALEKCAQSISEWVDHQSGRQFPVSGIVLENIANTDKPDYRNELYLFRDGVSVNVKGFPNKDTTIMNPTPEQQQLALDGEVEEPPFQKARIQSTTVSQYLAFMKRTGQTPASVDKLGWLAVSRLSFQNALKSDSNLLLNAWATDPKVVPCLNNPQKVVGCLIK